jgi:hypothetical protein
MEKIHKLLGLGFMPNYFEVFNNDENYTLPCFKPLHEYDYWVLEGFFYSKYCPHEGLALEEYEKQYFTLKASVSENKIFLQVWGEVWADYLIIKNEENHYENFTKKQCKIDILNNKMINVCFINESPKGVIYLLKGLDFTKIGISKQPYNRSKTLGTKLPFDTKFLRHYILDVKDLRKVENKLHKLFNHFKSNGEWFSLTSTAVLYIDFLFYAFGDLNFIEKTLNYNDFHFIGFCGMVSERKKIISESLQLNLQTKQKL